MSFHPRLNRILVPLYLALLLSGCEVGITRQNPSVTAPESSAPVAEAQSLSVTQGSSIDIALTPFGSTGLAFMLVSPPAHGTLIALSPTTVRFVSSAGYVGLDSFSFTLNDGQATSAPAQVTITIVGDTLQTTSPSPLTTTPGTAVTFALQATTNSGGAFQYSISQGPLHGTATVDSASGQGTYTPVASFAGSDSFQYSVSDGTNVVTGMVQVQVTDNSTPQLSQSTYAESLVENQPLTFSVQATDSVDEPLTAQIKTNPSHGQVTASGLSFTYTPASGFTGTDSFTFQVSNGTDLSAVSTVNLSVSPLLTAVAQSVNVIENTVQVVHLTAIAPQGATVSYALSPTASENAQHASLALDPSTGAATYTPFPGYTGDDAFYFIAKTGNLTSKALVTIHVVSPVFVVSSHQTITTSGTYTLSQDVVNISIANVTNVTLDCGGRSISGSPALTVNEVSGLTLKNCGVYGPSDFENLSSASISTNQFYGPVTFGNARFVIFQGNSIYQKFAGANALLLFFPGAGGAGAGNNVIEGNRLYGLAASPPTWGIEITYDVHDTLISNSIYSARVGIILAQSAANEVDHNTVYGLPNGAFTVGIAAHDTATTFFRCDQFYGIPQNLEVLINGAPASPGLFSCQ